MEEQFADGLRFPLSPFLVELCSNLDIIVGELHPETIQVIVAFVEACRLSGKPPTLYVFYHFVELKKCTVISFSLYVGKVALLFICLV